ncbi:hypothetical protein ACH5RR_037753 [Cinchona calisaya]|uniref:Uncharacterized protein n=1 Tax=Cinchona calisaya TaxID=153742 RepID=A0ABD2YAT2_9GENT
MADGDTLVSSGETFVLGFFKPLDSTNRYLGIWYKRSPETIVWVANREIPLTDSNGVLTVKNDGNLVLFNGTKGIIWSSNSSGEVQGNLVVAELLDSGNFVLRRKDDFNTQSYIWQSFDFLTDTLLPGMKEGSNLRTGQNWYLTSWKNQSDPSFGEFTYKLVNVGLPQFVLRKGLEKKFRSGPWNGQRFSGFAVMNSTIFTSTFVYDVQDVYYTYALRNSSELSRLTLNESGIIQRFVQNEGSSDWLMMYTQPHDMCEEYGMCGVNGICRMNDIAICECLEGFVPKSQGDWDVLNWSSGCRRRTPLDCKSGEGFTRIRNVKLPDLLKFQVNKSMTFLECKKECLKDCNCTAFTNSDITNGGSGCLMWFGDLIDVREFRDESSEQDIYLRLPESELGSKLTVNVLEAGSIRERRKKKALLILVTPIVSGGMIFLCLVIWCMIQKRKKKIGTKSCNEDIELPLFQLEIVTTATNSFSFSNIIGEGGFGPVYKAWLSWNGDKALQIMDDCLKESFVDSQLLRCIQVALLCVQKLPEDRPTMASVVFMLSNETVSLPQPKHPGFFLEGSYTTVSKKSTEERKCTGNAVTITMLEGR